jgi:hypothetical protein
MPKKTKPWPKCVAPLCDREADERMALRGDHGEFVGELCSLHADLMRHSFPARMSNIANLRPVFLSLACPKCGST